MATRRDPSRGCHATFGVEVGVGSGVGVVTSCVLMFMFQAFPLPRHHATTQAQNAANAKAQASPQSSSLQGRPVRTQKGISQQNNALPAARRTPCRRSSYAHQSQLRSRRGPCRRRRRRATRRRGRSSRCALTSRASRACVRAPGTSRGVESGGESGGLVVDKEEKRRSGGTRIGKRG